MAMITELTKEQEALMDDVRDEWLEIGLATAPKIKKMAAREAIVKSYRCADLKPPKKQFIHFGRSPLEGAIMVAVCKDLWENKNETKPTWDRVKPLTDKYMEMRRADEPLPDPIKQLAQDAFQWACYGQHDAGWLAFYDYFQRIGVEGLEQLDGLKEAARYCGWWWPMSEVAVITEKPTQLHLDDQGRLHWDQGRSIEYNDEWGLYTWHGTNVPSRIITDPMGLTADDVIQEENAEIRRIMTERMGPERFLEQAKAQLVNEDKDQLGLDRKLLRVEFPNGDPWVAVQVYNSTLEPDGSRRQFVIPVPPNTQTAKEAVAWTFGMEADEYAPQQET